MCKMTLKELDGYLHYRRRNEVSVIWENGQLPLLQHPIGCDPFLYRAELISVSSQDEGGCHDLRKILDGVARRLGDPIECLSDVGLQVTRSLGALVVRFHQFEHRSHLFR